MSVPTVERLIILGVDCSAGVRSSFFDAELGLLNAISHQLLGKSIVDVVLAAVVHGCDDFSRTESFVPEREFIHLQAAVVVCRGPTRVCNTKCFPLQYCTQIFEHAL